MSKSPENDISCGNCVGACCRQNTAMELTLEEASYMLRAGNKLDTLHQPVKETSKVNVRYNLGTEIIDGQPYAIVQDAQPVLTAGHGMYVLLQDCVFLEQGDVGVACTAYEQRPGICRDFEEGGEACRTGRENAALVGRFPDWQPVEIQPRT